MKKLYVVAALALMTLLVNDLRAQRTEVTFYTTKGHFKVLLTDSLTTVTVDSFLARVNRKFYDGLIFHRVIANFMIQGGDPLGTGGGGTGTTIPDEFHSSLKNVPGALAMANIGTPNSGDCQFYINVVTNSHLDNKHTVFGMVMQNYSIVDAISKVQTSGAPNNKPLTDVVMDSIRVTKFPVGVENLQAPLSADIYPNPTNGIFSINTPAEAMEIMITDINGRIIYKLKPGNADVINVDMTSQSKGVYLLNVVTKQTTFVEKIIIR